LQRINTALLYQRSQPNKTNELVDSCEFIWGKKRYELPYTLLLLVSIQCCLLSLQQILVMLPVQIEDQQTNGEDMFTATSWLLFWYKCCLEYIGVTIKHHRCTVIIFSISDNMGAKTAGVYALPDYYKHTSLCHLKLLHFNIPFCSIIKKW
jgi:hypothetical protein